MGSSPNFTAGLETKSRRRDAIDLSGGTVPDDTPSIHADAPLFLWGTIPVYQEQLRQALALLPWVGGAVGGAVGAPGLITGIGGAGIGGVAGKALEDLGLKAAGLSPVVTEGPQLTPALEEVQRLGTAGGEQMLGEVGGKVAGKVLGASIEPLKESAVKSMEQTLGATKETLKHAASEHVAPQMVKRGVWGYSRASLLKDAISEARQWGRLIDEEISRQTEAGATLQTGKLIDALDGVKEGFLLRDSQGALVTGHTDAIEKISSMQDVLKKYGDTITLADLRNLRKFWDEEIAATKRGFFLNQTTTPLRAEVAATDAIRDVLNRQYPSVAELNHEFHFWADMRTILSATQERTGSQSGLMNRALSEIRGAGTGAVVGAAAGLGVGHSAELTIAGTAVGRLLQTSAWKTTSAVAKDRLANLLAKGDLEGASKFAIRIMGGAYQAGSQTGNQVQSQEEK